jgi:hypothetical protein
MKTLTDKEYLGLKTLEKRLRRVFYRYNLPGTFDEFFNEYHNDFLRGVAQKQELRYYAIDYLRRVTGKYGQKIEFSKKIPLESAPEPVYEDDLTAFEIHNMVSKMRGKFRVIAGLKLVHQLTNNEIGFLFNVSESRIVQMIKDITGRPFHDLPFGEDQLPCSSYSAVYRAEAAARILGVPTKWLRDQLKKYEE